ncbi:MAG: HRDC domain-containing protein, partial [Acidobacteria bacterium]|nr:HRDC domain-containing protein [Acidobacteriota bacterium]
MKCKSFKIHFQDETRDFEEAKLNKFLENLNVSRIFSNVVGNEFWSVLVFYDDEFSASKTPQQQQQKPEITANNFEEILAPKTVTAKFVKAESAPTEPICLNAQEEKLYAVLREWRNELAARDGLPPYMIAHNDSLMTMAKIKPQSPEELVQIKGFGEKRAQ